MPLDKGAVHYYKNSCQGEGIRTAIALCQVILFVNHDTLEFVKMLFRMHCKISTRTKVLPIKFTWLEPLQDRGKVMAVVCNHEIFMCLKRYEW